jgi:transposase
MATAIPARYAKKNWAQERANSLTTASKNGRPIEHLRRPHDNLRSKDTSQSQFHCVNTACGEHLHADMNAAINIGKKWLGTTKLNVV